DQARSGRRLGDVLVRKGLAAEGQVAEALAGQLSLPYVPPPLAPEPEALARVQAGMARAKGVLPLTLSGRRLRVVMADPLDLEVVDDLRFQSGCRVEPAVSTPTAVGEGILAAYGGDLPELLQ
ncbi:MAG: type II secretion system protein GspE, partial [Gemmatimonadetes bacterium]|nr:type II secretion system protein GspE [Gemmatimonadota bacterium]NIR38903.1 type II secretion system protein GspE [Actinomycetota bacterium]NIU68431.1 type II secretion system protein GspE [Actinomycetota bacterium]NIW30261.1 type II secretion system protein GspE [Actinomycetota bacterium]NIX22678.1 type II secretion system protein GspE [Actinomycetota bacterium]